MIKKIAAVSVLYCVALSAHADTLVVGHYVDDPSAKAACQANRVEVEGNWCSSSWQDVGDGLYQYYHAGKTVDPIDYYYFQFYATGGCPDGTEPDPDDGECVEPEPEPFDCEDAGYPAGSVYDESTESCSCPVNTIEATHEGVYQCYEQPADPECDEPHAEFVGYFNGEAVCDYAEECGDDYTGGFYNDEWMCVPDVQCDGWYMNGWCVAGGTESGSDQDGDGIPDEQDDDIDGDGTPNSQDPDMDGDGAVNEDDPDPWGQESGDGDTAMTSSGCDAKPSCDGNPIQCQQLMEMWRNRCENPALEDAPDELANDISSGVAGDGESALDGYEQDALEAIGTDAGMEFDDGVETSLLNWLGLGGSCTDWVINTPAMGPNNVAGSFTMSCASTALVRHILGFAFAMFTIMMLYQLARKPIVR